MNASAHTPGPWRVDGDGVLTAGGWVVAMCHRFPDNNDLARPANARLIAAAPDLLALARRYAAECGECGGSRLVLVERAPDEYADAPCEECTFIWEVIDQAEGRP